MISSENTDESINLRLPLNKYDLSKILHIILYINIMIIMNLFIIIINLIFLTK